MKTSAYFLLIAFGASTPSTAQELSACLNIQDPVLRLSCYDDAAGYQETPEADAGDEAPVPEPSLWQYSETKDGFTNADTSRVVLESDKARVPMTDAPIALVVRCDGDGGTDIFVVSGGYIGSQRERVPVRFKFGDGQPVSEVWHESTDGKAAFLPDGYQDFREGLRSGGELLFEITDFRGSRSAATFPATTIGEDFDRVFVGCRK